MSNVKTTIAPVPSMNNTNKQQADVIGKSLSSLATNMQLISRQNPYKRPAQITSTNSPTTASTTSSLTTTTNATSTDGQR